MKPKEKAEEMITQYKSAKNALHEANLIIARNKRFSYMDNGRVIRYFEAVKNILEKACEEYPFVIADEIINDFDIFNCEKAFKLLKRALSEKWDLKFIELLNKIIEEKLNDMLP